MNELANTLRMYAEDMHSRTGFNYISRTMSQAADRLEELEKERDKLILAVADHVTARCELAAQTVALRSSLQLLYSWANNWDSEFMNDPEWRDRDFGVVQDAINLPDLASEVLKRRGQERPRGEM